MTVRRPMLTDAKIEQLLLARSADPDPTLVADILARTVSAPQRTAGWPRVWVSRRALTLIAVALLLAALAGAIAIGGGWILPDPNPDDRQLLPDTNPVDAMAGQYIGDGTLRIFAADDPQCTSIPVDGACFRLDSWWGLIFGRAEMSSDRLALTGLRCDLRCDEFEMWDAVKGSTTYLEPRSYGFLVVDCEGWPARPACLTSEDARFERVGDGLPAPVEIPVEAPTRYGWPGYDNLITFTLPVGWDGVDGWLHKAYADQGAAVEVSFGRVLGEPSSWSTDQDARQVTIAGYEGWVRDLPREGGGRIEEFVLDIEGSLITIDLRTGPRTSAADRDEALELLNSIRAAPGE